MTASTAATTQTEPTGEDAQSLIEEAVVNVDRYIAELAGQSLADTGTVIDMLLDLRGVLTR